MAKLAELIAECEDFYGIKIVYEDTTTLILFLKEAEEYLEFKYSKVVADAGYESDENYLFLEQNG